MSNRNQFFAPRIDARCLVFDPVSAMEGFGISTQRDGRILSAAAPYMVSRSSSCWSSWR